MFRTNDKTNVYPAMRPTISIIFPSIRCIINNNPKRDRKKERNRRKRRNCLFVCCSCYCLSSERQDTRRQQQQQQQKMVTMRVRMKIGAWKQRASKRNAMNKWTRWTFQKSKFKWEITERVTKSGKRLAMRYKWSSFGRKVSSISYDGSCLCEIRRRKQ